MRRAAMLSILLLAACGGGGDDAADDDGDAGGGPVIEPGDPGAADVRVDVRTDTARVPISPLIYGTNSARRRADRPQVLRSGGNRMTAYNWENNASNAGSDYCSRTTASSAPGTLPARRPRHLGQRPRLGATAVLTVPIVDYVAADKRTGGARRRAQLGHRLPDDAVQGQPCPQGRAARDHA